MVIRFRALKRDDHWWLVVLNCCQRSSLLETWDVLGPVSVTSFVDARGLCRLEASSRSLQEAFFASSVNPERAPWRVAAIQRGLCILDAEAGAARCGGGAPAPEALLRKAALGHWAPLW
eukprot:Skav223734  [mRNA]  locus=scaffold424:82479:85588:- [translate_table: standard]